MNPVLPFTPPLGYYDQPFTYIYDGSALTDGADVLNQNVRIQAGFGDFILRRAVGWGQVVPGGQFQLRDAQLNYLEADPIFLGQGPDEITFPNGVLYPEQSQIRFDLYNVLRPVGQTVAAQVAFQGVRRVRGTLPELTPPYRFKSKSYTYLLPVTVPTLASANAPGVRADQLILDYDFELENLIIIPQGFAPGGPVSQLNESGNGLSFAPVGQGCTIVISQQPVFPPLVPACTVTVFGTVITINLGNFGAGISINGVLAAFLANPAATALATPTLVGNGTDGFQGGATLNLPGGSGVFLPLAPPLTSLLIYDASKSFISQLPVPDMFYNGAPFSPYVNGAIVPPLVYPRSTSIRIDVFSLMTAATAQPPIQLLIHLIGKNRIPC